MKQKFFGYIFGIVILVLLIWFVDFRALADALSNLSFETITQLIIISIALIYVSALKWGLFIERLGMRVGVLYLFCLYLIGYFVNLVMPSYLGGDAVRSFYVGRKIGQHEALAATVLERYTGLVAMLALGIIGLFCVDGIPLLSQMLVIAFALGLFGVSVIALLPNTITFMQRNKYLNRFAKHFRKIQEALQLAKKDHSLLLKALVLSLMYHVLTVINTVVTAHAVGWFDAPVGELFVLLPLILVLSAIPIAPQGLGLQEGAFVFFLSQAGATHAQALGVAVILRAKSILLAACGGCVWPFMKSSVVSADQVEATG